MFRHEYCSQDDTLGGNRERNSKFFYDGDLSEDLSDIAVLGTPNEQTEHF
jgi:hypothetical protein